ncbi:RGS domain-containing protein [Glomus cerebriforme]|uniref:RGS domain-containing protein n=1 Tax=Glomus cerebriforme TaxID=658196 RepID=A0A397T639_9GLOM|nr:RGS domain-containing protein [Glomus cerebriforme]
MSSQGKTSNNTSSEKDQRLANATYPTYKRDRLPTLQEVLSRKTAPPVCLYNFYLYMRDREKVSEYLDFYLDVLEHEVLCKAYVKDLKKLGLDVDVEYPEYERFRPGGNKSDDKFRLSTTTNMDRGIQRHMSSSSRSSDNSISIDPSSRPESPSSSHIIEISNENNNNKQRPLTHRDSVRSNRTNTTTGNLSFYNRERPFTRDDLRESAERIYFKYVFEGSEKEIILSDHIREKIAHAIEEEGDTQHKRDDPWIFYEAKKEIFAFMERVHFPRFLKARAFGNMHVRHIKMRLAIGLFCLFIGFAVVLSLIFLDRKPKTLRLWSFIPIFFGINNLFAYLWKLSPLFVLLKISETKFFHFQRVKEPYIYTLHVKRGIKVFLLSLLISIIVMVIFTVVPGHRL